MGESLVPSGKARSVAGIRADVTAVSAGELAVGSATVWMS